VGSTYCYYNDIYRKYRTYTCSYGGTALASCSYSDADSLIEDCGNSVVIESPLHCSNNSVVKDIFTTIKDCNPVTVSCYSMAGDTVTHVIEVCGDGYACVDAECVFGGTTTSTTLTTTTTDSCVGVTCDPYCSGDIRFFDGYCSGGVCYHGSDELCAHGCSNGECNPGTTTTVTSTTLTTTTTIGECDLPGDYPPCDEVTLDEVIDFINLWAQDQASLSDVLNLIHAWALG
jgi:hypothetical protein